MEFRVLGSLEVWSENSRIVVASSRHQRVLAALLLSPNTVVPLPKLVEVLWEQRPPATATKQVQNCVSALRERFGAAGNGLIATEGPGYRVMVTEDQLDLLRFQCCVAKARGLVTTGRLADGVAELRSALRLWRGPALDGVGAAALAGRVARLDEQRISAIEQCVDWRLALGEHGEVVDELAELAADHPLREGPQQQLMLALYRCGRQAEALAVFRRLRTRLADELGVDPGAEVRELHERMLRADPALAGPLRSAPQPAAVPGSTSPVEPTVEPVPDDPGRLQLDRAQRELAVAITRQWTAEVEMRSLYRPAPVHVRWSDTGRPVAAVASAVLGEDQDDRCEERLSRRGDLTDVVSRFRELPAQQLVVLGEPGAGKTVLAVLLTLGLLADPVPGSPTPVLLSLASWDPQREHLHSWLTRTLVEEYPGLANPTTYGPDVAARLVAERRVLPVLDGLDETPPALHAAAIDALDRAVACGGPLVVTCRSVEYERAARSSGAVLARAAVIEIEPVELKDAIAFLTARERIGEHRWEPVVDHLVQHPAGALAQALVTPLMVDLARTAFTSPTTDPAELCDPTRFSDRRAIEEHLLAAYLPAVYPHRPPPPAPRSRSAPLRRHDPEHAQRWLTFLAAHLHGTGVRELAWWRLRDTVPRTVRSVLPGVPPAVLFAITGWLAGGAGIGLVYGLCFALAGCTAHAFGTPAVPMRVELRFRGVAARFVGRFSLGAACGAALGLGWSLAAQIVALLAVVFGFSFGLHVLVDAPVDAKRVTSPSLTLEQDRRAALLFGLSFAVSMGLFYAVALAFTREVRFLPVWEGTFDLVTALAAGLASTFLGRFLNGRVGIVVYGLAGAVVGGLVFPRAVDVEAALAAGTVFGLAVGLMFCSSRAWGVFCLVRIWSTACGRTPLRLMQFLDDAHRRGVLRQVGAVYQFRHARLQNCLADEPARPATTVHPASPDSRNAGAHRPP
jgi:DNA-binding SARP family transcriptional activator